MRRTGETQFAGRDYAAKGRIAAGHGRLTAVAGAVYPTLTRIGFHGIVT
jgi:hypothetical protein